MLRCVAFSEKRYVDSYVDGSKKNRKVLAMERLLCSFSLEIHAFGLPVSIH